jgi:hypothetical protein
VVEEEQPGEFDGFINDSVSEEDPDAVPGTPAEDPAEADQDAQAESPLGSYGNEYRYVPDRCQAIGFDDDGNEMTCGNLKNPAEVLCHDCRVWGHRVTGLL